MLGCLVDALGVVDTHDLVDRGVKEEERPVQLPDPILHGFVLELVQEPLPDRERPPRQLDLRLSLALDLLHGVLEELSHVPGVAGGGDGGDRPHRRDRVGRLEHRRAAQRVTDQDRGRLEALLHELGRGHQVFHVRGVPLLAELALALADAREVEPEHRDPLAGQPAGDMDHRLQILRAREAVREDRARHRLARDRELEASLQLVALRPLEPYDLRLHPVLPSVPSMRAEI